MATPRFGVLGGRHMPAAGPRSSHAPGMPFAEYVDRTRERIKAAVADLDDPPAATVIEQRLPFELAPGPEHAAFSADGRFAKAALLLHGLLDTPYIMRDIGNCFAERGYLVRAPLLPGHGTRPGDLLEVDYREWIDAVAYGIDSLVEKLAGEVTLIGFSLGATLAVHHVLRQRCPAGITIKALVMLSPGFRTTSLAARLGSWLMPLRHVVRRIKWPSIQPDADIVKYESLALNAVVQFNSLAAELGDSVTGTPVTTPLFVAAAARDSTIDAIAARRFFLNRATGPRRMIWYTADPEPTEERADIEQRSSVYSERRIQDFSHVCLPVNPTANRHYGAHRQAYRACHHYFPKAIANWQACKNAAAADVDFGEPTAELLRAREQANSPPLCRLTFNPDFDYMTAAMFRFLDRLD